MNNVNTFIKTYNVTDCQAAKILGVSPGNLSDWKSGKREIPKYITASIDLHLDISTAHKNRIKELSQ